MLILVSPLSFVRPLPDRICVVGNSVVELSLFDSIIFVGPSVDRVVVVGLIVVELCLLVSSWIFLSIMVESLLQMTSIAPLNHALMCQCFHYHRAIFCMHIVMIFVLGHINVLKRTTSTNKYFKETSTFLYKNVLMQSCRVRLYSSPTVQTIQFNTC